MAALVQTIPQQSGTVSVLQTRPSSSSGAFTPSQSSQQQNSRNSTMSWNSYNTASGSGSYRVGHQVVAPYAFTSTPNLSSSTNMSNRQSWSPHLRAEHRTSSAPSAPQLPPSPAHPGVNSRFANHPAAGSVSTSSSNSSIQSYASKDDTAIPRQSRSSESPLRPLSTINLPSPPSPNFMNISSPTVSRPSPDRYRRGTRRPDGAGASQPAVTTTNTAGSGRPPPTADDHLSQPNAASGSKGPAEDASRKPGHNRVSSADESSRTDKQPELAKRYRRRSWGNMDNAGLINLQLHLPSSSPIPTSGGHDYFDPSHRPNSAQSNRDGSGSNHSPNSSTSSVRDTIHTESASSSKVVAKSEETKRITKPSPLSQPVTPDPAPENTTTANPEPKEKRAPKESIATQRLAEITNNDFKRPGKSRLRRAFSFGSASELLKASAAQNSASKKEAIAAEKARRELLKQELGPEQAAIAEQQEASGLGESIYSHHQGRFFNSSTDNLSVSSTASSASIMLRKMGKGMKRSTRSLVGLFRPKSIVSTASNDGVIVEPMAPQLSVVNVEAERKSVAVNPDPQDVPRGGTVLPKVEPKLQSSSAVEENAADNSQMRKSIVGGDRERAEVLAAVRKGILKKTAESANSTTNKLADRPSATNRSDTPHSSVPSTPEDQTRSDNRRSDAVRIAGEDDFLPEGRFLDSKGASIAPVAPKSLVFSPRIQFHDTWPSGEYDRRGEIATCNRLTPLLAQQIKEELNNFKMEMEVHETSKIYTHFL
ncbi:hypothetical protein BDV26DRAFT_299026 [Aspergillus bertholletiae]|uniref:Protein BNI4 n=1 Tax=Aspergillus bertholletiae TaxID=1226010 RepID=A0A5N7AMS5_9EURO|nr:hypothetical protein BDV26DRAFT_299026 [Aspergillus bertholletiae]